MLEETFDKFKKQLQSRKSVNTIDLPQIVSYNEEQVHQICSYNHYPIKTKDEEITKSGQCHNDIYEIDEIEHEFEYGIYEDVIKTEQFMADLKRIDEEIENKKIEISQEYNEFPIEHFANAGKVLNDTDKALKQAADTEIYELEQEILDTNIKSSEKDITVSHVQDTDTDHIRLNTVHCPVYVPYNDDGQEILLPTSPDMSRQDNLKALYKHNDEEQIDDYMLNETIEDGETYRYMKHNGTKEVMVQSVYVGALSPVRAHIFDKPYSMINYDNEGTMEAIYDGKYTIPVYIDNGSTINIMPTQFYNKAKFLHHLPKYDATGETIRTGNGKITTRFWTDIQVQIQGIILQLKLLICDTQADTGILLSKMALEQLEAWQDYSTNTIFIKQTSIPLFAIDDVELLPGRQTNVRAVLDRHYAEQYIDKNIQGSGIVWVWSNDSSKPMQPIVSAFYKDHTLITFQNNSSTTQHIDKGVMLGVLDMRSKLGEMTNFDWEIPIDDDGNLVLYAHTFASALEPTKFVSEDPLLQAKTTIDVHDQPRQLDNKIEGPDPYPWLDAEDPRRDMTDDEILRTKVPLKDSSLNAVEKERLYDLMTTYKEAFSIRDEIGTCPFFEVRLELRDDKPFFVRPYNIREDLKPVIQKEMDRLEKLGIIKKGLTGYSSPVLLVKRKQQNLYRVVTDFRVLNERLVRVNHAFPIVRDCLEAIGASECEVMSVLDLRDAYHTLPLAEESQKFCGLTPYYGSPTYIYQRMGMGMSCSPALWQQFVHIIWEELPNKERYKIIMDDILIFSTKDQHWEDLENLFHVLIRFGLKISPHKCQLFRKELVYMGLQFLVKDGKAHYTAMKDKCDAIRNMQAPKSVKECRTFCGMVNFLSSFCKNLREMLIPIYELTKKRARFKWTDTQQKAFDDIKKLLVKPPILRMVSGDGIFRLESDTSRTAAGGTLYQWQDQKWVLVGYHSKKLPDPVQNYGVTELELTGLLANIHGFEQKLRNNYFEVIVDHKAIDYLTKSKHQPATTRLANLLFRLFEYTFDLKYLEGNKLKVSDALSRLYIEEKHKVNDVIPLNFLIHFTDYQIHKDYNEGALDNYAHNHQKHLPQESKRTGYDRKARNQPISRFQIEHKTPKTKIQKVSHDTKNIVAPAKVEKHPVVIQDTWQQIGQQIANKDQTDDNTIPAAPLTIHHDQLGKQTVNTIREVPEEYLQDQKELIPAQDKLSVFRKHIPKQKEIDALLANLRRRVLHNLMVNLDTKDLIEAYPISIRYKDIYNYVKSGRLPGNLKTQKKIAGEASTYVVINNLLFKILQYKESGKWVYYMPLVIPEKFEANIMNMYHNSLLGMHQGPYKTFLTIRKQFHFPNMLPKLQKYIEACTICQRTKPKRTNNRPYYGRIPEEYIPCENLAVDLKSMPKGILGYEHLLIATCEKTNFVYAIPLQNKKTQTLADALIHRVFFLTGPPSKLSIDQDAALTSQVIKEVLNSLECTMQVISPWNHGSSKAERQIQTIGNMINKHLSDKGVSWPLYASMSAYAMNTFASTALQGLSPFELVFARKPRQLTGFEIPKLRTIDPEYREFFQILMSKAKLYRDMDMEWRTLQALELRNRNEMLKNIEVFEENDLVYLLAPHSSSLQTNAQKFRQDYVGPLAIDTKIDETHYLLKDVQGRTLKGDYHINRIKHAAEITPTGIASTFTQLRQQAGLPITKPQIEAAPTNRRLENKI